MVTSEFVPLGLLRRLFRRERLPCSSKFSDSLRETYITPFNKSPHRQWWTNALRALTA